MPRNLWNEAEAAGLSELELLVYRSRLLGADRSVCNVFGGNTSAKLMERDFRGRPVRVLWVKGSGSDLATITLQDFAALRLEDVLPLLERESLSDEELVDYLAHCYFKPGMPRPSIETLLHAFLPARHVDHTHPDAILSLATSENGPEHVRRLFGERAIWIPYRRPGFPLNKMVAEAVPAHPQAECIVMAKHGLVTWGEDARTCYENTIRTIQKAEDYVAECAKGRRVFGGVRVPALPEESRRAIVAELLPILRGEVSRARHQILCYDDSPEVLEFAGSERAREVALVGAACPDHVIHTKPWPLFIGWDGSDPKALKARVKDEIQRYRQAYRQYFEENKRPDDTAQMMDPSPRIILIPGLGLIATGKDAFMARVARDLYHRAIEVMRGPPLSIASFPLRRRSLLRWNTGHSNFTS